ncbi:MAG: histidine phosphotransferase family protein [Rhodospirillaceae bacterium]
MTIGLDQHCDVDLAALLSTRLCHDLAGPVGAVSAGVELLSDDADPAFVAEAIALLRHSADASSARLRFFRTAFGEAGRSSLSAPARSMVEAYVGALSGGITVEWRDQGGAMASGAARDGGAVRLLLMLCLVAADSLAGGGGLIVELQPASPSTRRFAVTATGLRVGLDAGLRDALAGRRDGLTPRSAPAYLLQRLAAGGGGLVIEETPGRVLLAATYSILPEAIVNPS